VEIRLTNALKLLIGWNYKVYGSKPKRTEKRQTSEQQNLI